VTARPVLLAIVLLALGCAQPAAPLDAAHGADAARADAGLSDAGSATDSASPDAATIDSARPDSAGTDAAITDVTTVRIVYPAGHTITIRGSAAPLSWTSGIATTDLGGGSYELQIHGLTEPIELKPLLDDATWSRGPNFHVSPGERIEIAPHFTTTAGRFETLLPAWSSTTLGNTRPVYAYFPAAYDENTEARFTVLYMHDGQNLWATHPELAFGATWEVDTTIDLAGETGRCPDASACSSDGDCGGARCDSFGDTIVIGVGNTSSRIYEYTPTMDPGTPGGGGADTYLDALVSELKPMVDAMLRTRTAREDTALMGSSLGGLVSIHGAVVHPETFGIIGAMSPSTWWDSTEIITEVSTIPTLSMRALRVYVDSGDSGASMDDVTDTAALAMAYRDAGYVEGTDFHYLVQAGGQHNEAYWAERLPGALAFMLPRRERALP
jgi:predicted alpha/beta superfamily hydrolase